MTERDSRTKGREAERVFGEHRDLLMGAAYRLLGRVADAVWCRRPGCVGRGSILRR